MEEDVGAKAPVTRLRRRLSVEQSDEVKSPSAPSTPSKKRGGKLAAKPQLELIDENLSINTPRKTKKTAAKDVIEASEEKVLTPARRSTRIKSNTSIISDTPQGFDSPRAKRAARRNSQIGSDNEAPITPARSTRRTRKDSTTSVDKQGSDNEAPITPARSTRRTRKDSTTSVDKQEPVTSAKKTAPNLADSIIEEVESDSLKSSSNNQSEKSEITPKRKSPRLLKKGDKLGNTTENEESLKENAITTSDKIISDESFQLINSMNDHPVYKTNLNNSDSSVNPKKPTRNRTKTETATENLFSANHDTTKQNKIETKGNDVGDIEKSESNNNILEADNRVVKNDNASENDNKNVTSNEENSFSVDDKTSDKIVQDKENTVNNELNEIHKLLKKAPVAAVQSFIYYDDSDSDNKGKSIVSDRPIESEDQCVPVVPEVNQKSVFNQNENDREPFNDTCEPMDIDETIPNNISLINSPDSKQNKDSLEHKLKENIPKSPNNSKRESPSSLSRSQNIEKSGNENKSTLLLSQLKDVSTTDNSLSKSHKTAVNFLSNSVTDVNNDKDIVKKDSRDYMTSTPLQQKNLKKMAIQINTSVINNSNNVSTNTSDKKYNKIHSKQSDKSCDDSSSEESEHVSSKEKNDLLDDEAEEVSHDYESGDSQDEEEREYEKENEIPERGETLVSSDNDSDDTDYEKDSFVVSSDEEDNDLLSGSDDDLSMSDNELTQSRKSKKKFDKRKLKEQKKASREMFEARHNISNNSTKSDVTKGKKNKRQRLNSSTLISEEEIVVKPKKNKRLKLDSSQDSITEEIISDSKVAENKVSIIEEHETMTVCNESIMNKNDPLSIKVKSEPPTPLKDMNISTVPIHDEIEEIKLDQNLSVINTNETSDPLQEVSDASSISENMEITSNYDSVLKELNNVKEKNIKSLDMSLNLNKKTKQSAKPTIVDNLNLTNTKKSNNVKSTLTNSDTDKKNDFDESSSDSIDLQLLFSEDSCDSVKKNQSKTKQETERFIPLKRTEAKTNILEDNTNEASMHQIRDMVLMNQSNSLNTSLNKKKKKKNSMSVSEDITSEKSNISLNITNHEVSTNSVMDTSSKKKKKKISVCNLEDGLNNETNISGVQENLNISQKKLNQNISMNTSLNSSSKKKKKNSFSVSDETVQSVQGESVPQNEPVNDSSTNNALNTSSKKKKNSVSSVDETESVNDVALNVFQNEISHNLSINNTLDTSSKKKKKKNSISVNEESETMKNYDQADLNSMNSTLNTSSKKKKKKNSISVTFDTDKNIDISSTLNTSSKKNSISMENEQFDSGRKSIEVRIVEGNSSMFTNSNEVLTESSKKKKKHNYSVVTNLDLTASEVIDNADDSSNTHTKKKKNVKANDLQTTDRASRDDDSDAAPEEMPYTSHKNSTTSDPFGGVHMFIDTDGNQDWNTLITSGSSKKKDKKNKEVQETAPETNDNTPLENDSEETAVAKKRKRKLSANSTPQELITADPDSKLLNMENKKKKPKTSHSKGAPAPVEIKETTKKKTKKRKEREDDDVNKSSKVFKQNSSDKISVPRLPATILDQLEDKPSKEILEMKKAKVVSTTQFVVEEAKKRKNKPSNYLEQSVYLNDSVEEKKHKGFIKIPKVLPFVPTATISGSGFTTKFQINVLQKETKFVAQTSNLTGFKNEYLGGKKIIKMGTYELYKSQRNRKLSKF